MKKYVDIFIFKSILEKGSLYMANVACYYLKIREFCLGDLTSMLQALESDLIKSFQKISMNNSGCNEMYPSFADCHYHKGDLDSAFKYYSKAIEYDLKYLKTMNVNQRPKYWEHCRSSFENVIKLSTKLLDNKDAACKAYNALLVSKSDLMNYKENNWQQVKNSLNENDVAIEFFYDGDSSLCALVVKKNFDSPELVTLGKSGADIWQPLERFFSQGGDVYFSPAGELSNVDVKNESEDVPVQLSEKFKIHRVQSTCDIVNER
jgi:tetratricopeptide (TPR) repeat protein